MRKKNFRLLEEAEALEQEENKEGHAGPAWTCLSETRD